MKTTKLLLSLLLVIVVAACDNNAGSERKPAMTGAPYELIVSVEQPEWDGEVGDTLRSIFLAPVEFINQTEPLFDLQRIKPQSFDNFIAKHRNVLMIVIDPEAKAPRSAAQYDYNSSGQIVVVLTAPDDKSMAQYLDQNRQTLLSMFDQIERDRAIASAKKYKEPFLEKEVEEMFGIHIDIPRGYISRGKSGKDFMVISTENRTLLQGVIIYSYPYAGRNDLSLDSLVAQRNRFDRRFPGPSGESYMTTSDAVEPELTYMQINGRPWARMRGFWETTSPDYMGGPFVSYSTIDSLSNRIITLDTFVYSPKKPKRNAIRSLDAVVYSATFPKVEADTTAVESIEVDATAPSALPKE